MSGFDIHISALVLRAVLATVVLVGLLMLYGAAKKHKEANAKVVDVIGLSVALLLMWFGVFNLFS